MYGQITPGRQYGFGTDNYLDVGFDSQIQYAGDQYSVTVKLTDIMEWQQLNATYGLGGSSNLNNTLNSFKANASFVWDHTYSVGFGYFNIAGSGDCNLYGSGNNVLLHAHRHRRFNNSFISSPNGNGLILDLAYLPFSHGAPFPYSTWNVRASACSSRSICTSTAARPISTVRIWAARITRRATIPCSPMRGLRSEGRRRVGTEARVAAQNRGAKIGREHVSERPLRQRFPQWAD